MLKVIHEASDKQKHHAEKSSAVLEKASEASSRTYNAFRNGLEKLASTDRHNIRVSALNLLWENLPCWDDIVEKAGNGDDPGDGLLYDDAHVAQAHAVINDFDLAWRSVEELRTIDFPSSLKDMSRICLVLKGMQQPGLLEDFLESGYTDNNLHLQEQELKKILKGSHSDYATTFYNEQHRAKPREWAEGSHVRFNEHEPMPFVLLNTDPEEGSFGIVTRIQDPVSNSLYVRKQQRIGLEHQLAVSARIHLQHEIARLRGLNHRHVVQLVKTYERGKTWGLILKPAATSDLRKLLGRYKENKFCSPQKCRDGVWLRPVFMTAFGCLSEGLAYIHNRKLRHKDVKPANILYERAMRTNGNAARFLWADFGLAYDFSDSDDSKTKSTKLYSARYAPPEVVLAHTRAHVTHPQRTVTTSLNKIREDDEAILEVKIDPSASSAELDAHGRSADVFGLGCVYFELLGALAQRDLPLKENEAGKVTFSDSIDSLCSWARSVQKSEKDKDLWPLLDMAMKMINKSPLDRPDMNQITRAMKAEGKDYSCSACWNDNQQQSHRQQPASSNHQGPSSPPSNLPPKHTPLMGRINSGLSMKSRRNLRMN